MNTGYKGWTTLEQYDRATGVATGLTKINSPDDPNYVAPTKDTDTCPLWTYTATRSQLFTRNNCPSGQNGESVLFTKTYTSTISQADADAQALADSSFTTQGQNYANTNGSCSVVGEHVVYVDLEGPPIQTGSADVYGFVLRQFSILPVSLSIWIEATYPNALGGTSSVRVTKTIDAGNTESLVSGWDITDGSPAGVADSISITSYTSSPTEYSIVETPEGDRVLRIQFSF